MKTFRSLVFLLCLTIPACQTVKTQHTKAPEPSRNIEVIGHRGAAGLAPENTLSSFKRAIETGVAAVELDVHLTSDGVPVVHHDYGLSVNTTRLDGSWVAERLLIKDMTLKALKKYDVGRLKPGTKYSKRYPQQQPSDGERIPTLREVVNLIKDKNIRLLIEIKTNPEKPGLSFPPDQIAEAVLKLLREEGITDRVMILAFDWRVLQYVQKVAPSVPTIYLTIKGGKINNIRTSEKSPWTAGIDIDEYESIPYAIKMAGGRVWAPFYKQVKSYDVEKAHRLDLLVYVWTPDTKDAIVRLVGKGVDAIITNRPDIAKEVLDR